MEIEPEKNSETNKSKNIKHKHAIVAILKQALEQGTALDIQIKGDYDSEPRHLQDGGTIYEIGEIIDEFGSNAAIVTKAHRCRYHPAFIDPKTKELRNSTLEIVSTVTTIIVVREIQHVTISKFQKTS